MKKTNVLRPALAAFMLMMAMALTTSALSFFVTPVCQELELGRGSFTLYYSLMTASGAVALSALGSWINRRGVRGVMLVAGVWVCAGFWLFSVSGSLWMFYAAALLLGVFGTSCISLCANVIVQQSCAGSSGILGAVMAGSGVGGMIVSMVLPGLLSSFGWRWGYRLLGCCWLVLVLGAFFLLGKQEIQGPAVGHRKSPQSGMTRAEALRSPKLYLVMAATCIVCACCGIQQQLPAVLAEQRFDSGEISRMMTVMTGSLAVGKIVQGILYGRVGERRGSYVMLTVFAVSFLMLLRRELAYPGLVALAFGMGVATTLMPGITRVVFGPREFAAIWSVVSVASSVGSFVATPVWGMVYDATGSYDPAMLASPALLAVAMAALTLCFREKK